MKYIMEFNEWQLHQSEKDGHYEAWKTWGERVIKKGDVTEKVGGDVRRIVLMADTLDAALSELRTRTTGRKRHKSKDNPDQMRIE